MLTAHSKCVLWSGVLIRCDKERRCKYSSETRWAENDPVLCSSVAIHLLLFYSSEKHRQWRI